MKHTLNLLLASLPLFSIAQDLSERVPKSSYYVITINPGLHAVNGDLGSIARLEMFAQEGAAAYGEGSGAPVRTFVNDVFSKPAETGVDNTKKLFIFREELDTIKHWTYVLPLSNAATFKNYVTGKLFKEAPAVEKGFGYEFFYKNEMGIAWTEGFALVMLPDQYYSWGESYYDIQRVMIADSIAAATAAQAEMEMAMDTTATLPDDSAQQALVLQIQKEMQALEAAMNNPDSLRSAVEASDEGYENSWEKQQREEELAREQTMRMRVKERLRYLMNMTPADAVISIRNFRTVQAETFDAAYWYNYGEMIRRETSRPSYYWRPQVDTMQNVKRLWDDSYTVALARFMSGELHVTQRLYLSPEAAAKTKGMYTGKVSKKMFRYVKGPNLMGYAAFSMNVEKMLKFSGSVYRDAMSTYNSMTDGYMFAAWDAMRVFIDDDVLYNLFSGDLLVAVTDLKPFTASYVTYDYDENFNRTEIRKEKTEVLPEFVALASIGKKKEMQRLIDIVERTNGIKKQGSNYYSINLPGSYDFRLFLAFEGKNLILTNNEELVRGKLKKGYGKSQRISGKLVKQARKSPLSAYWDGTKTFELISREMNKELSRRDKETLETLKTNISSATVYGMRPENGVQTAELRVKFTEGGDSNGLLRFFRIINSLYLINN